MLDLYIGSKIKTLRLQKKISQSQLCDNFMNRVWSTLIISFLTSCIIVFFQFYKTGFLINVDHFFIIINSLFGSISF
ncbi:hypothetical protein CE561_12425 [Thermoanaerobacterium thermosaccharolyticum]|uniref:Uncharacterized protein n=1 Tax=Thermoanaerobacterium thermosaccharolyticum TaxID=1517 RepID=A0A231VDQ8_THETR|nr:hypothetical protein CE561_12425 [Thermoanaerobacterium thermosaccharolyticum]